MERLNLPDGPYEYPRVSPDGKRITFGTDNGREAVVWVYDLAGRSAMQRLTIGGKNRYPIWSADGQRIAFQSDRGGCGDLLAAGRSHRRRGAPDQAGAGDQAHPRCLVAGRGASLVQRREQCSFTLSMLTLGDRTAAPFGNVESTARATPDFSPDGGGSRIRLPSRGRRGLRSTYSRFRRAGHAIRWPRKRAIFPITPCGRPMGKSLFTFRGSVSWKQSRSRRRRRWFSAIRYRVPRTFPMAAPTTPRTFDIAPNGKIVSVVIPTQDHTAGTRQRSIQVVLNWFEELKATGPPR